MKKETTNSTANNLTENSAQQKDVHPDHVGRDEHGNIADPDLPKDQARSGSKGYNRFVLSKSMVLILILMPVAVALAYFLTR